MMNDKWLVDKKNKKGTYVGTFSENHRRKCGPKETEVVWMSGNCCNGGPKRKKCEHSEANRGMQRIGLN